MPKKTYLLLAVSSIGVAMAQPPSAPPGPHPSAPPYGAAITLAQAKTDGGGRSGSNEA